MGNRFFVYNFLFDFHSVSGSTATPSVGSNVSKCELGKFRAKPKYTVIDFFSILIARYKKSGNPRETFLGR